MYFITSFIMRRRSATSVTSSAKRSLVALGAFAKGPRTCVPSGRARFAPLVAAVKRGSSSIKLKMPQPPKMEVEGLKKKIEQLERELGRKRKTYEDVDCPEGVDLPHIMRICTVAERAELVHRVNKRFVDGEWTLKTRKFMHSNKEDATITMVTAKTRAQKAAGERVNYRPTFLVTHVLLLGAGKYPTESANTASHVCMNGNCLNVDHIVWEGMTENRRREVLCRKKKKCACGLMPPCDFTLH